MLVFTGPSYTPGEAGAPGSGGSRVAEWLRPQSNTPSPGVSFRLHLDLNIHTVSLCVPDPVARVPMVWDAPQSIRRVTSVSALLQGQGVQHTGSQKKKLSDVVSDIDAI